MKPYLKKLIFIIFVFYNFSVLGDDCLSSFKKSIEYVKYGQISKATCIWEKLAHNDDISAYNLAVAYIRFSREKKLQEKWLEHAKKKELPQSYFEDLNFREENGNLIWKRIDFKEGLDDLSREIFINVKKDFIIDYFINWVIGWGTNKFLQIDETLKRENHKDITEDIYFLSAWIDINGDDIDELLINFPNIGYCGSGGCPTFWFAKQKNKWFEYKSTFGDYNPFYYSLNEKGKIIGFINYDKYKENNFEGITFESFNTKNISKKNKIKSLK